MRAVISRIYDCKTWLPRCSAWARHPRTWEMTNVVWGLGATAWALWSWQAEKLLPLTALGLLPVVLLRPVLLAGLQVLALRPHAPDLRAAFVHHLASALVRRPLYSVLTVGLRLASVALTLLSGAALWHIHPLLVIFALTPLLAQQHIGRTLCPKEEV